MSFKKIISVLGCGWLGLPLARSFVKLGYEVKGSTTSPSKISELTNGGITPFLLELTPAAHNNYSFFDSPHLFINLPPRNKNDDNDYYSKQLRSVKEIAIESGVKKIIFISSTGVYLNENKVVSESDASYQGLSRAGISLLKMEEIFTKSDLFETTVVRFGGLYGPSRNPANFLRDKKNLSGADNPVNMIHQEDCIALVHFIIENGLWNQTFNGVSNIDQTRKAFYQKAAEKEDVTAPTFSNKSQPYKKVSSDLIRSYGFKFNY